MSLQHTGWRWDRRKAAANVAKHGVSFELATLVFEDEHQLNELDEHQDGDRWRTIGRADAAFLLVIHTFDAPDLAFGRIISARKAMPHERKRYEAALP